MARLKQRNSFFIAVNGKVYIDTEDNKNLERYDLESIGIKNTFSSRIAATHFRDIIMDYKPMAFYGKRTENKSIISCKDG